MSRGRVDLRQQGQAERRSLRREPVEELEGARLDHEAARPGSFDAISHGVESDNTHVLLAEETEMVDQHSPRQRGADIEVDLLRRFGSSERRPDAFCLPGLCDGHCGERRHGPAEKDAGDVFRGGVASRPDLVEGQKQIGMRGSAAAAQEVLELGRAPRDMVDHQVDEHIVALADRLKVSPGAEGGVDLPVGGRRKAAVAGRGERRQKMDAAEACSGQRPRQEPVERGETASQRIGIGDQLRLKPDAHGDSLVIEWFEYRRRACRPEITIV